MLVTQEVRVMWLVSAPSSKRLRLHKAYYVLYDNFFVIFWEWSVVFNCVDGRFADLYLAVVLVLRLILKLPVLPTENQPQPARRTKGLLGSFVFAVGIEAVHERMVLCIELNPGKAFVKPVVRGGGMPCLSCHLSNSGAPISYLKSLPSLCFNPLSPKSPNYLVTNTTAFQLRRPFRSIPFPPKAATIL